MANRPHTKKPIAENEDQELPEPSKNPGDFIEKDGMLYCTKCGAESELHVCKCGKRGPKAYMDAHLENREKKGHQKNHARVVPAPVTKETPRAKPIPMPDPTNEPDPEPSRMVEIPAPRKNIFDGKRRK